jgi:RNA polymerase sigma factor for flagellar operon FliA
MNGGAEKVASGAEDTLGELIERNLDLVGHVVMQVAVHFPRYVDRGDLARAGALGLVEAARRFDAARGVPFEKFAARRIRGAILDSVRAADWAPRSVRTLARRLEQVEQRLANGMGQAPTRDEVAEAMGLSVNDLASLRDRVFRSVVLALDYVVTAPDDDDLTLVDVLADRTALEPSEQLESRELLGYLHDAVGLLPERHRTVIVGYFLENRTSIDLADELSVTESRVSQLRTEALTMLREGIASQYVTPVEPTSIHGRDRDGRASRRKAGYAAAIESASDWRSRLAAPLALAGR